MLELDELFISPHAVEQFQQRIASMSEAQSRFFIGEGIRRSVNVKLLPDGGPLRVRTRRPFPFEFRAFVVFDRMRHNWWSLLSCAATATSLANSGARRQARKTRTWPHEVNARWTLSQSNAKPC